MPYLQYHVSLTDGQKESLLKSYQKKAPVTLRLKHHQLSGNDEMLLTKTQIGRIEKSKRNGTGTDIKISKAQVGGFLGALGPMLGRVAATALPWVTKAAGPLLSGALSGVSSFGVNKILGNGLFSVPQDKVDKLVQYKDYLTKKQKEQIVTALQSGSGIQQFQLTKKQHGDGFGTILASIGIPMLLNALTGKGLQVERYRPGRGLQVERPGRGLHVQRPHGGAIPTRPPPFYGTWGDPMHGAGAKKKKKKKKGEKKTTGKGIQDLANLTGIPPEEFYQVGLVPGLTKKEVQGNGLLFGKNSPLKDVPLLNILF